VKVINDTSGRTVRRLGGVSTRRTHGKFERLIYNQQMNSYDVVTNEIKDKNLKVYNDV